jgi:hypothetical protein
MGQQGLDAAPELPLVTSGDDLDQIAAFLPPGEDCYRAADVIERLLAWPAPPDMELAADLALEAK